MLLLLVLGPAEAEAQVQEVREGAEVQRDVECDAQRE